MGYSCIWRGHPWPTFVLLTLFVSCITDMSMALEVGHRQDKKPINVVLLLPMNRQYMFSYTHIFPALEIALEKLEANDSLLPGYYFKVRYNDTECHEALGMKYAIEYFFANLVDVFFGPVCDYTLAPILRQATYWNLPMVTVGANAWGFFKFRHSLFPMLTRVGPVNHNSLVSFFLSQVTTYNWTKVKVIYEKEGQDYILTDFCHLTAEVLMKELTNRKSILNDVGLGKIENGSIHEKLLLDQIALDYGEIFVLDMFSTDLFFAVFFADMFFTNMKPTINLCSFGPKLGIKCYQLLSICLPQRTM